MESKIELTERLRREGRWGEASRFKETALKDLRAKGMKRNEASEAAWEAMATAFPPIPPTPPVAQASAEPIATMADSGPGEPSKTPAGSRGQNGQGIGSTAPVSEEDIDIDALLERFGDRQPPDLVRDTLWAYEALSNRKAKPEDAPSLGAWSMLQWARQYRNRFFEQVLPKAMAARTGNDEDNQMDRRERMSIEKVRGILGQFQADMDEELRADVPGVLQQRVRDMLSFWVQQCGVSLADKARARLDSAIVGLIRDSMRALPPASGGE